MTMPHLMNCPHSEEGWCLQCVNNLHIEAERSKAESAACIARVGGLRRAWEEYNRVTSDYTYHIEEGGDSDFTKDDAGDVWSALDALIKEVPKSVREHAMGSGTEAALRQWRERRKESLSEGDGFGAAFALAEVEHLEDRLESERRNSATAALSERGAEASKRKDQ